MLCMLKPVCNLCTLSLNQFLNKLLDTMCLKIIYKREILQNTKRFLPTGTMEGLFIIIFKKLIAKMACHCCYYNMSEFTCILGFTYSDQN